MSVCKGRLSNISTHSPRAGRTHRLRRVRYVLVNFNSLAPCGANPGVSHTRRRKSYFNSLAPCGANPEKRYNENRKTDFNSLAPCGANHTLHARNRYGRAFQLTRPVRGEPMGVEMKGYNEKISTHSPRAGRTHTRKPLNDKLYLFQLTRPVRGEPCSKTS